MGLSTMAQIDKAIKAEKEKARVKSPAELIAEFNPIAKAIDKKIELDYSFYRAAITICDMTVPNAMRYGDLYTLDELHENLHKIPGDLVRRIKAFMGQH